MKAFFNQYINQYQLVYKFLSNETTYKSGFFVLKFLKIFFQEKKKKGKKDVAYIKYQYMQIFEETSLT